MIDELLASLIGKRLINFTPVPEQSLPRDLSTYLDFEGYETKHAVEVPYHIAGELINRIASSNVKNNEKGILVANGRMRVEGNAYGLYCCIAGEYIVIKPKKDTGGIDIFPFFDNQHISQDFGTDRVDAAKKLDQVEPHISLDASIEATGAHNWLKFNLGGLPQFVYIPKNRPTNNSPSP